MWRGDCAYDEFKCSFEVHPHTILARLEHVPARPVPLYSFRLGDVNLTGACPYNRPCAQKFVGKSQSCMVISGRLIIHAPVDLVTVIK